MMRTYGRIRYVEGNWRIDAEPHVALRLKRVFGKLAKHGSSGMILSDTPENARDLEWFLSRYPMEVEDLDLLQGRAKQHRESVVRCEELLGGRDNPRVFDLAKPARDYQSRATEILLTRRRLIVGDELGLGKSLIAIAAMTQPEARPALVVTLASLPRQWEKYCREFAPGLNTHIIKTTTPYKLPQFFGHGPDVLICSYHKLACWVEFLRQYVRFVVFDECQELRRPEAQKYQAARQIAGNGKYCVGLSATPIFNYGGEFHSVAEVISPGQLGTREEFVREWCIEHGVKPRLKNPRAFGTYLRDNFVMIRRTRKDVGRELPDVIRIAHTVDSDARKLHEIKGTAGELAQIILRRVQTTKERRWTAAGEFDMLMRQATGIAKAPYVADFVRILCESGEQIILCGWHREVYSIWAEKLRDLNPAWYTGSETSGQKEAHKEDFVTGRSQVLFMSLRAGQGVDGFQDVCSTIVFGELDWSPGVHEQCIGRIHRDGQGDAVKAYYLVTDDGADPVISDVLGIKREQVEGIRNPDRPLLERLDRGGDNIVRLAKSYLDRSAS